MNKIWLAVFALSVLLLSACSPIGSKNPMGDGFAGGDNGLKVSLTAGAPPPVIQDEALTPFSFVVNLENLGEAPVGPGTENPLIIVRLLGVVLKDFGMTSESATQRVNLPLEHARKNIDGTITPGEITAVTFDNLAYKPNVFDSLAMTFRTEVCYDYSSEATVKFCMKKDFIESSQDSSICMLKGPREVGNSGAPIHVVSVDEAPVNADTVQLNFKIAHAGKGVFFARSNLASDYDGCVMDERNPDLYKMEVEITPSQTNSYSFDCIHLDEKLTNGGAKGVVRAPLGAPLSLTCFVKRTVPIDTRVYEDLLSVKIRYRYGEFLEVPILVQGHP